MHRIHIFITDIQTEKYYIQLHVQITGAYKTSQIHMQVKEVTQI